MADEDGPTISGRAQRCTEFTPKPWNPQVCDFCRRTKVTHNMSPQQLATYLKAQKEAKTKSEEQAYRAKKQDVDDFLANEQADGDANQPFQRMTRLQIDTARQQRAREAFLRAKKIETDKFKWKLEQLHISKRYDEAMAALHQTNRPQRIRPVGFMRRREPVAPLPPAPGPAPAITTPATTAPVSTLGAPSSLNPNSLSPSDDPGKVLRKSLSNLTPLPPLRSQRSGLALDRQGAQEQRPGPDGPAEASAAGGGPGPNQSIGASQRLTVYQGGHVYRSPLLPRGAMSRAEALLLGKEPVEHRSPKLQPSASVLMMVPPEESMRNLELSLASGASRSDEDPGASLAPDQITEMLRRVPLQDASQATKEALAEADLAAQKTGRPGRTNMERQTSITSVGISSLGRSSSCISEDAPLASVAAATTLDRAASIGKNLTRTATSTSVGSKSSAGGALEASLTATATLDRTGQPDVNDDSKTTGMMDFGEMDDPVAGEGRDSPASPLSDGELGPLGDSLGKSRTIASLGGSSPADSFGQQAAPPPAHVPGPSTHIYRVTTLPPAPPIVTFNQQGMMNTSGALAGLGNGRNTEQMEEKARERFVHGTKPACPSCHSSKNMVCVIRTSDAAIPPHLTRLWNEKRIKVVVRNSPEEASLMPGAGYLCQACGASVSGPDFTPFSMDDHNNPTSDTSPFHHPHSLPPVISPRAIRFSPGLTGVSPRLTAVPQPPQGRRDTTMIGSPLGPISPRSLARGPMRSSPRDSPRGLPREWSPHAPIRGAPTERSPRTRGSFTTR